MHVLKYLSRNSWLLSQYNSANMCWLKGLRWAGILLLLELACVFSTTHSLDKISEWLIQLAVQSTWIGSWDSIYQIDVALSDVCGCRHSHLTLPQWREDVMGSSQALIWQGIPASETRRWQLSEAAHSARRNHSDAKTGLCSVNTIFVI